MNGRYAINHTGSSGVFWICFSVLGLSSARAPAQLIWVPHGPGPTTNGQVEGIIDGEVVGAVHDVAPHRVDPNIVFVGTVNGGVWRTMNASAARPHWEQLTDQEASLSIGALEFDLTDATHQTLVAGIGRFSSSAQRGGARTGLLRTSNGGASWAVIDGGGSLVGLNISGVAPRGDIIVVSANTADLTANRGVWRRDSAAGAWTQISGAAGSGLPSGASFDLVGDPNDSAVLYTNAGNNGLYRSADTGATWTKASDAAMDGFIGTAGNLEIAVGQNNNVFVAIVTAGRLASVFRSPNGSAPWTQLDTPQSVEGTVPIGIHPGGQGNIHLSITADPSNSNIVYVGGDRQPSPRIDTGNPALPFWPNSIGANNFTGRLYRIDASQSAGSQATPLTHSGTASNSAPHADSRDMAFDAAGDLLEADDGGIYRRTSPQNATGDWLSLNGDLQTAEFYGIGWDAVSNIVVAGAQDTGTPEGILPTDARWAEVHQGDGGDVAINDISTPNQSVRYTSSQNLSQFRRRTFDASNTLVSTNLLTPLPVGLTPQFLTPIEVNKADGLRLIVCATNDIYESIDQGSTLNPVGAGVTVNRNPRHPISYGASDDPNVLYVGVGTTVRVRTGTGTLSQSAAYPGTRNVNDLAGDPGNSQAAYVIDDQTVFLTTNAGSSWTNVTGDLQTLNPGALLSIEFLDEGSAGLGAGIDNDAIAVGAANGVYFSQGPSFDDWEPLGEGLPNTPVFRLEFDYEDRILLAGTLGRGAWTLNLTEADPTDTILVLDFSGSMLSPACSGCDPKLDVLKDSAELFVQLWRALATPDDRIGVNYFRTNVAEFLDSGNALHSVLTASPAAIADLRFNTTTSSQFTAMGAGIQQAINRLTDTARHRNIIVFTDGMQNVDPSVVKIDDSPPAGAFHLEIDDTGLARTSNINPISPPTRLDAALDVRINTIGVGATPAFVTLLADIASQTDALTKITTAPDADLRRFFVEELVETLRTSSPQLLAYVRSTISAEASDAHSFAVNKRARQVTFKVSWQNDDPKLSVAIFKDGNDVTRHGRIIAGPFYRILSYIEPRTPFELGGAWEIRIKGRQRQPYEIAGISDEPALSYRPTLRRFRVAAGEPLELILDLKLAGKPFDGKGRVRANITKPSAELGKLLYSDPKQFDIDLEKHTDRSSVAEAILDFLIRNSKVPAGDSVELQLQPDNEGRYVGRFTDTKVAGPYQITLHVDLTHEALGRVTRTESLTAVVAPGPTTAKTAGLNLRTRPGPGGQVVDHIVALKPRDEFGNFLGANLAGELSIRSDASDARISPWRDHGDGSYEVLIRAPKSADPVIQIAVQQSLVFKGKLSELQHAAGGEP